MASVTTQAAAAVKSGTDKLSLTELVTSELASSLPTFSVSLLGLIVDFVFARKCEGRLVRTIPGCSLQPRHLAVDTKADLLFVGDTNWTTDTSVIHVYRFSDG